MTVDIAALHKAMASVIDGYSKDWVTRVGDNGRVQLGSIDECGEFADFVEIYISDWSSDRDHDHELAAYFSAAHPSLIKKLIEQLEAAQARIAELESKQEPVPIYQYEHSIYNENNGDTEWFWADCDKGFYEQYSPECRRILYTAPPVIESEQEPVAWEWQDGKQRHVTNDEERARNLAWDGVKLTPLVARSSKHVIKLPAGIKWRHDADNEYLCKADVTEILLAAGITVESE